MSNEDKLRGFLETLAETLSENIADKIALKVSAYPDQSNLKEKDKEEYLKTNEAMKFLKISSRNTLKSYVVKGWIPEPTTRGGRQQFFKKSDLVKYFENGCK